MAVGSIADSGIVLRLTRSRLWIGALGALLVGIVGLNVFALSFNAASSKTAGVSDELRRENSALVSQIADGLSNERLHNAADRLGLIVPEPGSILYLEPQPGDAAAAAERLRKGAIAIGSASTTSIEPLAPVATPPAEPELAVPTEPVAAEAPVPTETATVTVDPATTATPAAEAGGITAP